MEYSEEKHRSDIEIDFLLSADGKTNPKIDPVEAKSSKNYTASSFEKFRKRFGNRIGQSFIVHPKAFSKDGSCMKIPTYMWFAVLEEKQAHENMHIKCIMHFDASTLCPTAQNTR